jgi:hypothetical protein
MREAKHNYINGVPVRTGIITPLSHPSADDNYEQVPL